MSATYEECQQVRDIIAEAVLDGIVCGAVGLGRSDTRDWVVRVMTNKKDLVLPELPKELAHVQVETQLTDPFKLEARFR